MILKAAILAIPGCSKWGHNREYQAAVHWKMAINKIFIFILIVCIKWQCETGHSPSWLSRYFSPELAAPLDFQLIVHLSLPQIYSFGSLSQLSWHNFQLQHVAVSWCENSNISL